MCTDSLSGFLAACSAKPLDQVTADLRANIAAGAGSWMQPDSGLHAPGTCFHEIQYLGICGFGDDEVEATRDWLKVARASLCCEAVA